MGVHYNLRNNSASWTNGVVMPQQSIPAIKNIIQFLYDGYECYRNHIGNVTDPQLKEFFKRASMERLRMIEEIQKVVPEVVGIRPTGTITGTVHKFYESLKALITRGDPLSISKEIKRGENILVEYYKQALSCSNMPESRQCLLKKHLQAIEIELMKGDILSVNVTQ